VNPAERLAELDAILTEELLEKELLGELPEAYRLVPLPLDEPEVAQKALLWAYEAPNPEGWPLVYAPLPGGQASPPPPAGEGGPPGSLPGRLALGEKRAEEDA
jgi:hypothetical protein